MLRGTRLKLERETLAIGTIDRARRVLTIPGGEIIHVVPVPKKVDGMVDVLWKDRKLTVFEVDLARFGPRI
jgi:hypothetical protein